MTPSSTEPPPVAEGWFQVHLRVPADAAEVVSDALLAIGATGVVEEYPELQQPGPAVSGERWEDVPPPPPPADGVVRLCGYLPRTGDAGERLDVLLQRLQQIDRWFPGVGAAEPVLERVPDEDWGRRWREHYAPVEIGRRLRVRPPWSAAGGEDRHEVIIAPGMAFGTGTHFTTIACLEALEDALEARPGATVLDVGTGTGVLALAALRLGASGIEAFDADRAAVAVARENLSLNDAAGRIRLWVGELAGVDGHADVVLANLLAPLLVQLAGALAERVAPGGVLIVSGLIAEQEDEVVAAFAGVGMTVANRRSDGSWVALELVSSS